MKEVYWNLLLFAIILLGLYIYFSNYNIAVKEGLENQTSKNGFGGNSKTYLEDIKQFNLKMKDTLNLSNSEYRKNYEDIIIALDDSFNYVMLDVMLKSFNSENKDNPLGSIVNLGFMANTRAALNNTLKFIDKQ
jgi:hypothetical protein